MTIERRKHPKFIVELPLNYSKVDNKEIYGGIVTNISEGGILAYLNQPLEIGDLLNIEIMNMRGLTLETFKGTVKVIWSDLVDPNMTGNHAHGLQFISIDKNDFRRLKILFKESIKSN